ncbi:amidohydrolase [Aestuariicella sp. G3-2]|uniref:amidohydrolase n=1 Tax=Pseudomaricurvus albidus TaxID=2842452 RepID=UPI001C0CC906|nr:amidohydrolase [Aestuariicella albida]MBU3071500.1 amidohydrolase [Aestuariicella albida]
MPQQDLRVSVVQNTLAWQDPESNRSRFGEMILNDTKNADLVVLPEMFTAGFSMDSKKVAEPADGDTLIWMEEMARATGAVITGSYAVADEKGGLPFNRLVWMRPDGSYETYNKRHLFRMAGEDARYQAGSERIIVELKGWRVCPLICYDLRFPVWCRNRNDYDLLVFVANWPAARSFPWSHLLKARAIENLACVVGVNRVGEDGNGHAYSGDSIVLDAKGKALVVPGSDRGVFSATLSAEELNAFREKFPAHLDADDFELL